MVALVVSALAMLLFPPPSSLVVFLFCNSAYLLFLYLSHTFYLSVSFYSVSATVNAVFLSEAKQYSIVIPSLIDQSEQKTREQVDFLQCSLF
jgi:hypothetical protein